MFCYPFNRLTDQARQWQNAQAGDNEDDQGRDMQQTEDRSQYREDEQRIEPAWHRRFLPLKSSRNSSPPSVVRKSFLLRAWQPAAAMPAAKMTRAAVECRFIRRVRIYPARHVRRGIKYLSSYSRSIDKQRNRHYYSYIITFRRTRSRVRTTR